MVTPALCALADLGDPDVRGVTGEDADGRPLRLIVARWRGRLHGYVNRCPHNGVPLDFVPGQFLDRKGRRLMCGTHGARFRVDSGRCTAGPCRGRGLTRVALEVRDGQVRLATPPDAL